MGIIQSAIKRRLWQTRLVPCSGRTSIGSPRGRALTHHGWGPARGWVASGTAEALLHRDFGLAPDSPVQPQPHRWRRSRAAWAPSQNHGGDGALLYRSLQSWASAARPPHRGAGPSRGPEKRLTRDTDPAPLLRGSASPPRRGRRDCQASSQRAGPWPGPRRELPGERTRRGCRGRKRRSLSSGGLGFELSATDVPQGSGRQPAHPSHPRSRPGIRRMPPTQQRGAVHLPAGRSQASSRGKALLQGAWRDPASFLLSDLDPQLMARRRGAAGEGSGPWPLPTRPSRPFTRHAFRPELGGPRFPQSCTVGKLCP